MESLGSVQQKISCVFETKVLDEPSTKRENQSYRVVASETVKQSAVDNDVFNARATEKLDGTCVYINQFEGKPWLWARFDRKPTKGAERRFKKLQQQKLKGKGEGDSKFVWDLEKDFKETPLYWIPASGVQTIKGAFQPDDIGHTPGWVPVSAGARQYCWHLSAVDLINSTALVLREDDYSGDLRLELVPLSELEGHTAELIGTNINGNPYGIGTKKNPLQFLVVHGSLKIRNPPKINAAAITDWFSAEGQVEGIVWHCDNKSLFKVHRNHMSLPWPVESPTLSQRPLELLVDGGVYEGSVTESPVFAALSKVYGHRCDSLKELGNMIAEPATDGDVTNGDQDVKQSVDLNVITAAS